MALSRLKALHTELYLVPRSSSSGVGQRMRLERTKVHYQSTRTISFSKASESNFQLP